MRTSFLQVAFFVSIFMMTNVLFSVDLLAVVKTFNTNSGSWGTSGNWTPSGVPASGDDVVFPSTVTSVTNVPNASINSVTIQGTSGTIAFTTSSSGNRLTITSSFSLLAGRTMTIGNGNRMNMTFGSNCVATIAGTLNIYSGGTTRDITNDGDLTITSSGLIIEGEDPARFTLSAGATLRIGSTAGITSSGGTGNVRTSTRQFNTGAYYVYNGVAAQNTGNGLPATVAGLKFDNSAGAVTLNSARTISGSFIITSGSIANLGTFTHNTFVLILGVNPQVAGSWGSTSSSATNQNNTFFALSTGIVNVSNVITTNSTGANTFIVPEGVTGFTVEAFGGGGRGGSRTTGNDNTGFGGGGGGGYSSKVYTGVTPLTSYSYFVGSGSTSNSNNGQDSWFETNAILLARGGTTVPNHNTNGGNGAAIGIGDITRTGGNGANGGSSTPGGGGGSSAGTDNNGTNATGQSGAVAPTGGGNGGNGGNVNSNSTGGVAGNAPGGGGGGAYRGSSNSTNGGNGANGQVIITINPTSSCEEPDVPTLGASKNPICIGEQVTLSITAGNLNGASSWQWYTGSCGGTSVGSGTSIMVSPSTTTTYYARGEGDCTNNCGQITITVNSLPVMTCPSNLLLCEQILPFDLSTLSPTPSGGVYSGTGVTGDEFDASVGIHTITYTSTDGNGCSNTCTFTIQVEVCGVYDEDTDTYYYILQDVVDDPNTQSGDRILIASGTYPGGLDAATLPKDLIFAPGASPGCVVVVGDLTLNSGDELEIEIDGNNTTCDATDGFDQWEVQSGIVTLDDATLNIVLGYAPTVGTQFLILDNDGVDPIVGTFAGLAEGAIATAEYNSVNYYFSVSYVGGTDNNDVVLLVCAPPSFTSCPDDFDHDTDVGVCNAVVDYTVNAAGNPAPVLTYVFTGVTSGSGSGSGSGEIFNIGMTTVTVTTTSDCGVDVCTFVITVEDNEPPVPTCQDHTVSIDALGEGSIIPADVYDSGTDNCNTVNLVSVTPYEFTCADLENVVVTLTVNDGNGNNATCTATVTVENNSIIASCPNDVTIDCDEDPSDQGMPSFKPGCGTGDIAIYDTYNLGSCNEVNSITRTFLVTDMDDNTETCVQEITVNNPPPPGPSAPVIQSTGTRSGDGTSFSVATPSGTQVGDLLVLGVYFEKGTEINTNFYNGTGWTLISSTNQGTNFGMRTLWKIATASEIGANITFNNLNTSGKWAVMAARITGFDSSAPIMANNANSGSTGAAVSPTVTTTTDNALVLSWHGRKNGTTLTFTAPATKVNQVNFNSDVSNALAQFVQTTAGATATVSASGSTSGYWAAEQIAIRPAAASSQCTNPVPPVIVKNPNSADACDGDILTVSVTTPGSDGEGNCEDEYRYSTDGGINWSAWNATLPSWSAIEGLNRVQSRRFCDEGCYSSVNELSWNVNPTPTCLITGDNDPVCPGTTGLDFSGPVGMTGYSWSISGGSIDGNNDSQDVTVDMSTTCGNAIITLVVTDDNGCTSSCTMTVAKVDNTPPNLVGMPTNTSASCDDIPAAATVTATDNCDANPMVDLSEISTKGTDDTECDFYNYSITRTWTATDACNNSTSSSQVITVSDTEAPTLNGVPSNVSVSCDDIPAAASVTATDNCDPNPDVSFNEISTKGSDAAECDFYNYTITRTWTATDACNNTTSSSQVITVSDQTAPSLVGMPSNVSVSCESVPSPASVTATDNCDANPDVSFNEISTKGSDATECDFYNYTITRTWTATDACNNSTSSSQVITVSDQTAPSFASCDEEDLNDSMECANTSSNESAIAAWHAANLSYLENCVTDNCSDVSITSNYSLSNFTATCGLSGSIVVSYYATDVCGNTNTLMGTFTIIDTTDPDVSSCPNLDDTTECAPAGNEAYADAWHAANLSALETCLNPSPTSSAPSYISFVRTTGTGNTALVNKPSDVQLGDLLVVGLMFEKGTGVTSLTGPSGWTQILRTDQSSNIGMVTWYKIATATEISASNFSFGMNNGPKWAIGISNIRGADPADPIDVSLGNTGSSGANVNAPSITTTEDNALVLAFYTNKKDATYTPAGGTTERYDFPNSEGVPSNMLATYVQASAGATGIKTAVASEGESWIAQQVAINAAPAAVEPRCDGNITITSDYDFDNFEPIIGNSGTLTVEYYATDECGNTSTITAVLTIEDTTAPSISCPADQTVAADGDCTGLIGDWTGDAVVSDNCVDEEDILVTQDPSATTELMGHNDFRTVTLTADDGNGNTKTCTFTVTLKDITAPTVTCKAATVQLNASGIGSLSTAEVFDFGTDNCGTVNQVSVTPNSFDCGDVGEKTVTLLVNDGNGNTNNCTATVTVEDKVNPVAICQDVTVSLDIDGEGSTTATAVDDGSNDACGIHTRELSKTEFDCNDVGTEVVTLTITDNNNNTAACTATVTIEDKVAPIAICQDVTIDLDEDGEASTSAAAVNNNSSDACGIATLELSKTDFVCEDLGNGNQVTLTVTDVNNNTSNCTATVTVRDLIPPSVVCKDITVQLDADGDAEIEPEDVFQSGDDNCGTVNLVSVTPYSFTCDDVGGNTVTLIVNDGNGNTNNCTATVTVEDKVNPVAICRDVTVSLDINGEGSTTATAVDNGSNDACGIHTRVLSKTEFDCEDVGTEVVTLTITDNNNNTAACTATVTIEDKVAPIATCQDVTIDLDEDGQASTSAAAVNNNSSDACGIATLELSKTDFVCEDLGNGNQVTLTVTDVNNNSSNCTAIVTVRDLIPPSVVCKDITVQLDVDGDAEIESEDVFQSGDDNCGTVNLVSVTANSFTCSDVGENTVTLIVNDGNGNTIVVPQ